MDASRPATNRLEVGPRELQIWAMRYSCLLLASVFGLSLQAQPAPQPAPENNPPRHIQPHDAAAVLAQVDPQNCNLHRISSCPSIRLPAYSRRGEGRAIHKGAPASSRSTSPGTSARALSAKLEPEVR